MGLAVPLYGEATLDGPLSIGTTQDSLYGGDMTGDSAGDGIAVAGSDGTAHFAHEVYADDAGTALTAGWVSASFNSMKVYTAVTGSINLSAFGLTGQLHLEASVSSIGNLCGIYGLAETVSGVTIGGAPFFGGLFGATIPSGATNTGYAGGIIIGGSYDGTTTGIIVPIFVQNPTSTANFDAAFAFGQNAEYAGCGDATADASEDIWGHLKVYMGGTLCYINLYSDAT